MGRGEISAALVLDRALLLVLCYLSAGRDSWIMALHG